MRGKLLVATPDLEDPNFFRTVVLMLEHSDEGALGVVLNRPSAAELTEPLPEWAAVAAEPAVVFVGGPVQPEAAIGLGRRAEGEGESDGFSALFDDLGTVDLERPPGLVSPAVDRIRVFAGYSGWGPGQLEAEIAQQGWFVVDSRPDDPWWETPESMWREVLRRQKAELRMFANFPMDPGSN